MKKIKKITIKMNEKFNLIKSNKNKNKLKKNKTIK